MSDTLRIATVRIREEIDVVTCRQSARQIAAWLELPNLEQIRFATAVSELARNTYQYAGGGLFHFDTARSPGGVLERLCVEAWDEGPGIEDVERILEGSYVSRTGMGLGLRGAQRLMDEFDIRTSPEGTRIRACKYISGSRAAPDAGQVQAIRLQLQHNGAADPFVELQLSGSELLLTTAELQNKQLELEAINLELQNTNKGVVALYSELEKANEEVREASASKSRFFANMTHEIRTPINIVENISQLLLNGHDGPLNPEQQRQVAFISEAASELSGLVNELLDLSKAESGRIEIAPTRFTLAEFTEQLRQCASAIALRYPALQWEVAVPASDVLLHTDRHLLFQALRNLIDNAFKYTPEGRISVRAYLPDHDTVEFLVEDTGIGVAEENLARVFEEFSRIRNPELGKVQGTGLGLPLAQRLASLLHGGITLDSSPGLGSRFLLRIRREHDEATIEVPAVDLSGMNILVVDDSDADRYLLATLLRPCQASIHEASNGAASIEMLYEVRPDLIFLDLDLPDIAGEDLLENMDWGMHSRVVINTAKPLDDSTRQHLARHSRAIVQKSAADYGEQVLREVSRLMEEQQHGC